MLEVQAAGTPEEGLSSDGSGAGVTGHWCPSTLSWSRRDIQHSLSECFGGHGLYVDPRAQKLGSPLGIAGG